MPGVSHVTLQGYNPSGSTTVETVWSTSTGTYAQLLTGTALEAVSSSANDAAAGTGARTIRVQGLDANYLPVAETVTLNGTTPVALANTSMIAVNSVEVLTAGSGTVNAGNIAIRTVSGSVEKSRISANPEGIGKARDFVYTTSALVYGLLKRVEVFVTGSTGDVWVYLVSGNSAGVRKTEFMSSFSLNNTGFASGPFAITFDTGLYIPKSTLIELRVDVSAGTPVVNANGELELHAV